MNNFKPVIFLEPWERRRPGLYANIPVTFLQVPVGEEGGPGELPNIIKEEEEKEKEEDKEEEMKGNGRDEEEI